VQMELPGNLHRLVAASARDIWALGERGALMHYDGQSWTVENPGTQRNLNALFELPTGEVLLVGEAGTVLRRAVR
jgi:hypothetical protein